MRCSHMPLALVKRRRREYRAYFQRDQGLPSNAWVIKALQLTSVSETLVGADDKDNTFLIGGGSGRIVWPSVRH